MRKSIVWLAAALAALVVEGRGAAQPPDRRPPGGGLERVLEDFKLTGTTRSDALAAVRAYQDDGRRMPELAGADLLIKLKDVLSPEEYKKISEATVRFRRPTGGPGRTPGADALVDRILSFDKDGDGKITKEELPERMQDLIAKGDTNKDGALDKDEIRKLAGDLAREGGGRGIGRGGRDGPGAGSSGVSRREVERAIDDLKLTDKKKEAAAAAVKASQENLRKLTELAQADLLVKMDRLLSADDLKTFKAAVERGPSFDGRGPGPGRDGPRPPRPPARP